MRYGSLCSGIEAATVAWHPLGWEPAFFAEIEKFPSSVLAHHYPHIPNLGDMTKFKEWPDAAIDVLVGGTPCQSFSVAGLRKGLADPRGNLALTYLAIADRYRPEWLVWENVPGVLSSGDGRDFGAFLGGLGELGYGFAYRVLDAQYVRVDGYGRAVPQRRRRVFVVGHSGDWRRTAAVLFERESLLGNSAPRREAREIAAATTYAGVGSRFIGGIDYENNAHGPNDATGPLLKGSPTGGGRPLPAIAFNSREDPEVTWDRAGPLGASSPQAQAIASPYTLAIRGRGEGHQLEYRQDGTANAILTPNGGRAGIGVGAIAFAQNQRDEVRIMDVAGALAAEPGMKQQTYAAVAFTCSEQANSFAWERDVYPTLDAQIPNDTSNIQKGIRQGWAVRRLTPRECERLQGFPDDYTLIPWRGGMASDGPRYKALGNSMAVNVMRWIGHRIDMVSKLQIQARAA